MKNRSANERNLQNAAYQRDLALLTKLPAPKPEWDGLKPGQHPALPLKPPTRVQT